MGRTALELPTTFRAAQKDRTIRQGSVSDAFECSVLGINIRDERLMGQHVLTHKAPTTQSSDDAIRH